MRVMKLSLLLLLSTSVLAQSSDDSSSKSDSPCLLTKTFKTFKRYEYDYTVETRNEVKGTSPLTNGPTLSCKVVIEVPQPCRFILSTPKCHLAEMAAGDPQSTPVTQPALGDMVFQHAMEKNSLKFTMEEDGQVKLFPEEDEPTTILNVKRGIISALLVPHKEEENSKPVETLHGLCETDLTVNSSGDTDTDITVNRDLSQCDHFIPMRDVTSPLALISGMNLPLSQLISSTQSCSYQFDDRKKHLTTGTCTEKHIFLPFSHQKTYGISALVRQTLKLVDSIKSNNRVFNHNEANLKDLYMEATEDKAFTQSKDVMLATLKELNILSQTKVGEKRAGLFHKLVSEIRRLRNETLSLAVADMLQVSRPLSWQALAQCGTPECTSAILQILRTFDKRSLEIDAIVYTLGFLSNPSNYHIQDILTMAQYKQSKAIMYSLSNSVRRRFSQSEGKITPEITAVAEFMASQLGSDCSGDKDQVFLTLRVLGNMGEAMEAANPGLKKVLLKCVSEPSATLPVQQAAIQAFRQMTVDEEARPILLGVVLDGASPLQKRLAAYLIVMKNPKAADVAKVIKALPDEQDPQAKSFIASHLSSILSSQDPTSEDIRQTIETALQGINMPVAQDFSKFSQNYKMGVMQGNIIFDSTGYMPKEIMLGTTLKAFGYHIDIFEAGMEGKGFEPSIEALFGQNGFFPDTILKTIYWAENKMPEKVNEVLKGWMPHENEKMKGQVAQNFINEIKRNVNKLLEELRTQPSPEAMAYLRIMGIELGYIKTSDIKDVAQATALLANNLLRIFPKNFLKSLLSSTDNEIFAHYIFMDNKFSLPTAAGFPLKFSLSATFAPGAKGGLHLAPRKHELSFRPSLGVEFITQMGVHLPEYILSSIDMRTAIYHESQLNTRLSMRDNQIKLAFSVPQDTTKLFSISNKLLSVMSTRTLRISPAATDRVEFMGCQRFFSGWIYCITRRYTDTASSHDVPYFPLTGESMFALEILPTSEITEYTATIVYEPEMEGKEGQQKVETLKMTLKAEGTKPSEATLNYNRIKNVLSSNIHIPDHDIEARITLGVTDSNTSGKGVHGITIDVVNKNVPQLSLIGRANLEGMKDGLLQVQLVVPALMTEATLTGSMNNADETILKLSSSIKVSGTSSLQKVVFKYDGNRAKVELMTDVDSKVQEFIFLGTEKYKRLINHILDQKVPKTDMKLRHIISKSTEAVLIWLSKVTPDVPYMGVLNITEFTLPSLPEELFLKSHSKFSYKFQKNHYNIYIPFPLGGISSEELNLPKRITVPRLSIPQIGLDLPSTDVNIPTFDIPHGYKLSLLLFDTIEFSTKMNSNFYNWEGSFTGGKSTEEHLIAKYKVMADSPVELLSYSVEGGTALHYLQIPEVLEAGVDFSLTHKLIDINYNFTSTARLDNMTEIKCTSTMKASSPAGLETSMYFTYEGDASSLVANEKTRTSASTSVGHLHSNISHVYSGKLFLLTKQMTVESILTIDSDVIQSQNRILLNYDNGVLSFTSTTNMQNDAMEHRLEFRYGGTQFFLKSDAVAKAFNIKLRNQAQLSATHGEVSANVETRADGTHIHAYSLITGFLTVHGLEVQTDNSMSLDSNVHSHKASFITGWHGLVISSTTNLQNNSLTFKNVLDGRINDTGTTLSILSKGSFQDMKSESTNMLILTFTSLAFQSKTENLVGNRNSYKHNIDVNMKPFTGVMMMNNDLKLLGVNFIHKGQMKLEPYKMDLSGNARGILGKENIIHRYSVSFSDLKLNAKSTTNGNLLGAHINYISEVEVTRLSAKLNSEASFKSVPFHITGTVHTIAEPFIVNTNVILNSNSDFGLYGNHTNQLYSKFIFKAEPLAVACMHDLRASTAHHLDDDVSMMTLLDHKIVTLLNPQEQRGMWKVNSKLNSHAYDQEITAYNNYERMGIEVSGTFTSPFLNEPDTENQEFRIDGYLKYDKNSDSHIVELPFIKGIFEQLKTTIVSILESLKLYINDEEFMAGMQNMLNSVSDCMQEYDIEGLIIVVKELLIALSKNTATLEDLEKIWEYLMANIKTFLHHLDTMAQNLGAPLKNAFENESFHDSVNDIFSRIGNELKITDAEYKIRSAIVRIINALEDMIRQAGLRNLDSNFTWLQDLDAKYEIRANLLEKVSQMKQLVEGFDIMQFVPGLMRLMKYHIPNTLTEIMLVVDNTKQTIEWFIENYDIIGNFHWAYNAVHEILIRYEVDKTLKVFLDKVTELIKQLKIKEAINTLKEALSDKAIQDFKDTIIHVRNTDFRQMTGQLNKHIDDIVSGIQSFDIISAEVKFPTFGKLYSQISLNSPYYSLITSGGLLNSTTNSAKPQFTAFLNSKASSALEVLDYTLNATVILAMPKMGSFKINKNFKIDHNAFSVDHQSSITVFGRSTKVSAMTTAKASTEPYIAEFVNSALLSLDGEMLMTIDNSYTHSLNIPEFSSQAHGTQRLRSILNPWTFTLEINNKGNGKWTFQDYYEEDSHQSDIMFTTDITKARLTIEASTNMQDLIMKQKLIVDSVMLRSFIINGDAETKSPSIKSSFVKLNGNVDMGDLSIKLNASHNTELIGFISGTISNSINFVAHPEEVVLDFRNKQNTKITLPMMLMAKIDLVDDYSVVLKSEVHQVSWVSSTRFNQYKYSHSFIMSNNMKDAGIYATINVEANLNFLAVPVTIPEVVVPFIYRTLSFENVSLWMHTGLKNILTTTQQSLNMDYRLLYHKPKDSAHTFGNLTSDLSFKSEVISLTVNTALYKQDDIVAQFVASSTSAFNALTGKFLGNINLTTKRWVKLATALSFENKNVKATHNSIIKCTKHSMDASVTTIAKVSVPIINLEFNQELNGNSKSTPKAVSKLMLKYSFNLPLIDAVGNGDFGHNFNLDGSITDISMETMTKGKIDGTIKPNAKFTSNINNEANMLLNADGLQSSMKTNFNSQVIHKDHKTWNMDMKQDAALEVSLNRVYAMLIYNNDNEADLVFINTKGKHVAKATLEFFPLTSLSGKVDIDISQPSSFGEGSLSENIVLEVTVENQKFSWKGREQLTSLVHTHNLLLDNNMFEEKMEVNSFWDGHVAFLKAINLPIYQRNLWEALKFDQVTDVDNLQFLKFSLDVVHTNSKDRLGFNKLFASATLSSPIYTTTWTARLENQAPKFITSIKSSCTSTLVFLEFDLDASFQDSTLGASSRGTLRHSDLNIDWQHIYSHPLSMFHRNLTVGVTSPTFTSFNLSYASCKDSIRAEITGYTKESLGFFMEEKDPLQLSGKFYYRGQPASDTDIEILTVKMSLRDSEMLSLQTSWRTLHASVITWGLLSVMPLITDSLYNFVNKYHESHLGMDIESAALELRRTVISSLETAHNSTDNTMPELPEMNRLSVIFETFLMRGIEAIYVILQSVVSVVREIYIRLPGPNEQLTLPQLWERALDSVSEVLKIDVPFMDAIGNHFSDIWVRMPYSSQAIPFKDYLKKLNESRCVMQDILEGMKNFDMEESINVFHEFTVMSGRLIRFVIREYFDNFAAPFTKIFSKTLEWVKTKVEDVHANISLKQLNSLLQITMIVIAMYVDICYTLLINALHQVSDFKVMLPYMQVGNNSIEINILLPSIY